jgi:CRP-like cAMP-binding protein
MKEMLTNKILTTLPDAEFARLMTRLEPVSLSVGERLAEFGDAAQFVYFPENAIISCHADMQDGKTAEVAMIGKDGVSDLTPLLGSCQTAYSLNVAIGGSALRVWQKDFERELRSSEKLRRPLLAYASDYVRQVSQRAACAILHRMEQRLAVWLLMLTDRLGADTVEVTHERIAHHLGVRRAGVTGIAGELQRRGVISYTRGNLRVLNRLALESFACECYGALAAARQQITHR